MVSLSSELIKKYDKAIPRYTSYPAYPYWNNNLNFSGWIKTIENVLSQNKQFSVYVHLPYCESLCYYCGCNKVITKNHDIERPYLSAVLKEWSVYRKYLPRDAGLRELHFGGGTPTFFSPENLAWFMENFLKDLKIAHKPDFSFEAHPGVTHKEHLDILRGFDFNRLSLGVQDFDPKVQKVSGRHQESSEVEFCTNYARKIGYESVNFDMIYGLPFQTEQSIENSFQTLLKFMPDRIAYYSYAHLPKARPSQKKLDLPERPVGEAKYALFTKGRELLLSGGYQELGFDHFSLPTDSLFRAFQGKGLHRNFMGYTVQNTPLLLGLGVSSIGDSSLAYAQNNKNLLQYFNSIHDDFIELETSYLLTSDDLSVKQHILNLSCFRKTDLSKIPMISDYNKLVVSGLEMLQQDGLVEIKNKSEIFVTDLGVPLIRNICVVFDEHFRLGSKASHSQSV